MYFLQRTQSKTKIRNSYEQGNVRSKDSIHGSLKRILNYQSMGKEMSQQKNFDDQADSGIMDYDNFSKSELFKTFYFVSENKEYIMAQDLVSFLEDENEQSFKKYEMIRLLDRESKGYVTVEEFLQFYDSEIVSEGLFYLPKLLRNQKKWKQAIQHNLGLFQHFENQQFCKYVLKKFREDRKYKDVKISEGK